MNRLRIFAFLAAFSLAGQSLAFADQWTYFYPESVVSSTCSVKEVDMQEHGSGQHHPVWIANAHAIRNDPSIGVEWEFQVAQYPDTDKGLDQANKACMQWVHEARKRIRKARHK